MKNVIYHEGQWTPEKDSLGFTGDMVKTAKSITATLLDAHNAIERNDADNVCSFYFDSAKRKSTNKTFEDIEDKYIFLKKHCNKIGRAVVDQIDMPFYKNIDSFSQGLENIDMQNFSVDNSFGIGHMSYAGNGPRFFRLESLTYMDIMSSSSVFDKILTSEYDLWKSQISEEDAKKVTFDQYRKAVSYVGDYDYKSIRDKQIGRELVFKIGVYTVAAIVAVPCVLTGNAPGALLSFSVAGYICGSTSVTGAITGTNPISGRTISSDERWVEGISGGVQVLSGAYGIYSYAPPAFANVLNTPAPPIRSVADIVDDVNNGAGGAKNVVNNPFDDAGHLKPNVEYQAGEYKYNYQTDGNGRISNWNTDSLQLTERNARLPHNTNSPGKVSGDHSGHLAGDRFGGSSNLDNIVSQSKDVNLSSYKKIENQWAKAIKEGKEVTVNVDVKYDGSGLRPIEFNVEYTIDGKYFSKNITN